MAEQVKSMTSHLFGKIGSFAVITTDTQGCIRDWNDHARRLFGYDDDFFGKHISMLCPQESVSAVEGLLRQVLDQGSYPTELVLKCHDGKILRADVAVFAVHSVLDEQRIVFLLRDDAEEPNLQRLLRERETLASIGAAAPSLAHQLGNPINGISATVQLLEHFLGSSDSPPVQSMLSSVRDLKGEVQRLTVLLNGFKSIAARQELAIASVDVQPLIRRAVGVVEKRSVGQNIQLSIDCDANLPPLNGDVEKLAQALLCVLENAIEAMPNGGHLGIKAYRLGQTLGIDVTDTGRGIPPGIKPFEPFASTKSERSGLGLFITQQIVLAHDGAVTCSSTPGQGTTIQFVFPFIKP
jgi:PAS domain S-box-containing protein